MAKIKKPKFIYDLDNSIITDADRIAFSRLDFDSDLLVSPTLAEKKFILIKLITKDETSAEHLGYFGVPGIDVRRLMWCRLSCGRYKRCKVYNKPLRKVKKDHANKHS